MEFLFPLLLYVGYVLFRSFLRKLSEQYQESDFPAEPPQTGQEEELKAEAEQLQSDKSVQQLEVELEDKYRSRLTDVDTQDQLAARKARARAKKAEVKKNLEDTIVDDRNEVRGQARDLNFNNLSSQQLRQGIVLTELLKSPRAKRPYRPSYLDRG